MRITDILFIFFIVFRIELVNCGKCVMYELCHETPDGLYQSCVYDGPPQPLTNKTGIDILKLYCPYFFQEINGDPIKLCCDTPQIIEMAKNFGAMAPMFKRCPSCFRNVGRQICDFTCDPNQSDYIFLKDTRLNEDTLQTYVMELVGYMSSEFMDNTYQSCVNVIVPSVGKSAVSATCGPYSGDQCTVDRWFDFLGNRDINPYAPMKVDMIRTDHPFLDYVPFNPKTTACYETYDNITAPCSCLDCPETCPKVHQYEEEESFTIIGVDSYIFILSIIYIFLAIILLTVRCSKFCKNEKTNTNSLPRIKINYLNNSKKNYLNKLSDGLQSGLETFFTNWGIMIAKHPTLVLALASWIVALFIYGCQFLIVTTDPVEIWSGATSQARKEKDFFESRFGPFYRTEQIFIKAVNLSNINHETSNGVIEFGPIFHEEVLLTVYNLQKQIEEIPGLEQICFAPLSDGETATDKNQCVVQSIWGYFQNDLNKFNQTSVDTNNFTKNYLDVALDCLRNSINPACLAPYGGNVEPALAVGGFLKYGPNLFEKSNSLVITYVVRNHINSDDLKPALEWESRYIDFMKNWSQNQMPKYLDVAFSSERSIQDELERESVAEMTTVIISYALMFIYISLALGTTTTLKTFFVGSKIGLGLGGVFVVILSVLCALGLFGYIGMPTTLLTIEVIPFLVLAVGVDNMFILVTHHSKLTYLNLSKPAPERVGITLGKVGPSLLLTTFSEAACFGIGGLTRMPAVQTFALYATAALIIDFILQMTVFVAFLTYNTIRVNDHRMDVFCCIKAKPNYNSPVYYRSVVDTFFRKILCPFIFNSTVSIIIVLLFLFWFCASIASVPHIEPGLEQQLSMPEDSYVVKYFQFMNDVFSMGPPVYFVLKAGINFSSVNEQNSVCGGLRCNVDSLNTQLFTASKQLNYTYLAVHASSWLDDFNDWSTINGCCKTFKNGSFCPHSSDSPDCNFCNVTLNDDGSRPDTDSFLKFLPYFLKDNPDNTCAKGGHAAYGQGLNYYFNDNSDAVVLDSYFMTYHTPLKTSKDFYTALKMAREIAANISVTLSKTTNKEIEVFPYSVFYVFYEQYLNIWINSLESIIYCIIAIFLVTFVFTGFDIISALIVVVTVTMIVTDLAALMYWWNINLNAVTLVNLVMAVGISVEFCSHIVQSFNISPGDNKSVRAKMAFIGMGSSVFSGITMTKFIGIIVLAFAKTQIFKVFYFRMYLGMIIFGAAHGLIFLPVVLKYLGNSRIRHSRWSFRETPTD